MKNVKKIDKNSFKIEDSKEGAKLFASTKKAHPSLDNEVVIITDIFKIGDGVTSIKIEELQVEGISYISAADACVALNSFIGSFKTGGDNTGGVSPADVDVKITDANGFINSQEIADGTGTQKVFNERVAEHLQLQKQVEIDLFLLPDSEDMSQWKPAGFSYNENTGTYMIYVPKETDAVTVVNAGIAFENITPDSTDIIFEFSGEMNTALQNVPFNKVGQVAEFLRTEWLDTTHLKCTFPLNGNNILTNEATFKFDLSALRDTESRSIISGDLIQTMKIYYSYVVLDTGKKIYFNYENTPLNNFATDGLGTSSITVNSQNVVKNTIVEVYFNESYVKIKNIRNNFLKSFNKLQYFDFTVFKELTAIGGNLLQYCSRITWVNFAHLKSDMLEMTNNTMAVESNTYPVYVNGLTVYGINSADICARFPNSNVNPYRNLINGGEFPI